MFQEWLRGREDLYGRLTEDDVKSAFAPFFAVTDRSALGNGRILLLLERVPDCSEAAAIAAIPHTHGP
jgi:hypothetical protein